jgi:aryl-phospho-beta-D-glucosidase BglC (GH1 family)
MKRFSLIPVYAAVAALLLVPALSAFEAEKAKGTATKSEKKSKKAEKKATAQVKKKADKAATATKEAAGTTEKAASQTAEKIKRAKNPKPASSGSAQRAMPDVSTSDIGAAKASGKVWVNTETGVYHKTGKWYGNTKEGKFMTEDEAIKAGFRASKGKN